MKSEELSLFSKYARHFFSGTFLSRISGMLRDVSMAAMFGDHPSVAAFMIAFRFSHFFRRILGEGALQSILIPQYQALSLKQDKSASSFFFQLTTLLFLLLMIAALIVLIFTRSSENEVLSLFAYLFPSLLFICLYGLNTSILQCRNSFFLSSMAPLVCNLVWLVGIFYLRSYETKEAMLYLSLFTTTGFLIQWLLTALPTWPTFKEGLHVFKGSLFSLSLEMKMIGKATLFGLIGITAVQINSFLDMIFARCADLKGPIYLWYAIRLQQLPLALIGFACIYSITPTLAKLIKNQSFESAQKLFQFGRRRIFLCVIPSTVALFALGFGAVDLLFGRGEFHLGAVIETTECLIAYGLGLLPIVLSIYYASLFYAFDDYKTPTFASLFSVGLNLLFNTLFVFLFHLGAISIALSTSFAAVANVYFLRRKAIERGWVQDDAPPLRTIALSSLVACSASFLFEFLYRGNLFFLAPASTIPSSFVDQLLYFCLQSTLFICSFVLTVRAVDKPLLLEIKALVFR